MAAGAYPLIFGWRFDGAGGGRRLTWPDVMTSGLGQWPGCWLHLNRQSEAARQWLVQRSGLDEAACKALLAAETRPRCLRHDGGVILSLRGVNLNEGAEAHDMPALRLWIDADAAVSLRGRRMVSPEMVSQSVEEGSGPTGTGDFVVALIERLTERIGPVIDALEEHLDALEAATMSPRDMRAERREGPRIRHRLARLRVAAVALRRHLGPQREALIRLATEHVAWLTDHHRHRLRELASETTRYLEDLDELRDTAGIIQDQIVTTMSEGMNSLLYKLTLVSAFFMPLSFLVGWFGSNVSGIILNESGGWLATQHGFLIEGGLLAALGVIEIALFRWMKWL